MYIHSIYISRLIESDCFLFSFLKSRRFSAASDRSSDGIGQKCLQGGRGSASERSSVWSLWPSKTHNPILRLISRCVQLHTSSCEEVRIDPGPAALFDFTSFQLFLSLLRQTTKCNNKNVLRESDYSEVAAPVVSSVLQTAFSPPAALPRGPCHTPCLCILSCTHWVRS